MISTSLESGDMQNKILMNLISSNAGKKQEFQKALPYLLKLHHIELEEIQTVDLEALVLHKLKQARHFIKDNILVEDTSLIFEAWGQLPGAFMKFFLQEIPMKAFYEILQAQGNFFAQAVCVVGFFHEGESLIFKGEVDGQIVLPRGINGFGWDSIFQPQGASQTFAEMEVDEKQKYSMRQMALEQLTCYLSHKWS